MRIIGLDPGVAIVGYCVLEVDSKCRCPLSIVTSGSIQTSKDLATSARLLEIHNDLIELVNTYQPDIASIEKLFYFKNAKTVMPVAEARGVIIMTLEKLGIPSFEYTPLVIKQTITGYGRAQKQEVSNMCKVILGCDTIASLDDTADAVAIAICHARQEYNI